MRVDATAAHWRILFVCAADNGIGFGHLNRGLALARHAETIGVGAQFLVFGHAASKDRVERIGFPCAHAPKDALRHLGSLTSDASRADVVISDLLFTGSREICALPDLFRRVGDLGGRRVAIDALGRAALTDDAVGYIDILLSPYAGATVSASAAVSPRRLCGPEYALLGPEYANLPVRALRKDAARVLVTCGGSDPTGYTASVLTALDTVAAPLEICVAMGPLFGPPLMAAVRRIAAASRHKVDLLLAPASLYAQMLWCDVAIATSGLTKYELAATATPSILFSIDAESDMVNQPFASLGTAIDLGVAPDVDKIASTTASLLISMPGRAALAQAGRAAVDGRGALRVLAAIAPSLRM